LICDSIDIIQTCGLKVLFVYEEGKEEMIDILMQRDLPLSGKVCSFSSAALVARQRLA
jgi:hypothetical protein